MAGANVGGAEMTIVNVDAKVDDQTRRQRLYAGELFAYSASPSVRALCEFARERIEEAFGTLEPRTAQHQLPVEEFVSIIGPLKTKFTHHPRSKELMQALFREFGCALESTYLDVPRLRVVSSDGYLTTGMGYAHPPHRDTWYSAPMAQINWWLPIYDLVPEDCLAFHPYYWDHPVRNDSHRFNYYEWNRERKTVSQHITSDTRFQPGAQEPIDLENQIRVITNPGGVILFSGAQLHSTVPNTSGVTRFSIDFRTVHISDLRDRCCAPNVDSAPLGTNLRDFLRATDLSQLPPEVIAMYDDEGAAQGREDDLVFRPESVRISSDA
jgi:hypothetical protein